MRPLTRILARESIAYKAVLRHWDLGCATGRDTLADANDGAQRIEARRLFRAVEYRRCHRPISLLGRETHGHRL